MIVLGRHRAVACDAGEAVNGPKPTWRRRHKVRFGHKIFTAPKTKLLAADGIPFGPATLASPYTFGTA
jgi:hypothetical protein